MTKKVKSIIGLKFIASRIVYDIIVEVVGTFALTTVLRLQNDCVQVSSNDKMFENNAGRCDRIKSREEMEINYYVLLFEHVMSKSVRKKVTSGIGYLPAHGDNHPERFLCITHLTGSLPGYQSALTRHKLADINHPSFFRF